VRYRLTHVTTYRYESDVSFSQNEARLRPLDGTVQDCLEWRLEIDPLPSYRVERVDAFGNHVQYLEFDTPHRRLEVKAVSELRTRRAAEPDIAASLPWDDVRDGFEANLPSAIAAQVFRCPTPMTPVLPALSGLVEGLFPTGRPLLEAAKALCARIHREYRYDPTATTVSTPLSKVISHKRGVCQDFAHLMVAALRSLGLAARYASGYLETLPPPGKSRLIGADASHAWVSVWCPGLGWVDLDPTNDCLVGERHIVLGWGRDYADVCPWKGLVLGGGRQTVQVSVDTAPLDPVHFQGRIGSTMLQEQTQGA
jgi:transglutaminase-like putative cysteine protease